MVRAGAVGTHLPASGLDIFGDLRKMNKRQVREVRAAGASRGENLLRRQGVGAFWVGLRQGQRPAPGANGAPRAPPPALRGPGFKCAQTHVWARVRAGLHRQELSEGRVAGKQKRLGVSSYGCHMWLGKPGEATRP